MCNLNFGVCAVFEFLAYEGMNGTTNLAVVDLSPYGFVFKELALQSLILDEFLNPWIRYEAFCRAQVSLCKTFFYGGYPPFSTREDNEGHTEDAKIA